MRWTVALFITLILGVASGPAARETNETLARRVRDAERSFARSMAERDLGSFASHVSEEAVFFGGKGILRGRAAVVDGWKAYFEGAEAPFSWEPERVEVLDSGELAMSSGPVLDREGRRIGTFNSVWRLEGDGIWRVVFDKGCPPCESEEKAENAGPSSSERPACERIHRAVLALPGTTVEMREGTHYDERLRRDLAGCTVFVSGTWSELGSRSNPGDSVYKLLSDEGWRDEPRYSADGPDGTAFALSKDGVWCFVRGEWDGGDDADSTYVASDVYQFAFFCARFEGLDPAGEEDE